MTPLLQSLTILVAIIVLARYLKRGLRLFQRFFIPSSLIAGGIGLLLGPQLLNFIPPEITQYWERFPKLLITVVFAGIFLGRVIPSAKEVWRLAGPQIAFGNTLAWGQYVIGILLTMLVLTPLFGVSPLAGALIEVSFEGGHGTVAGLAPTFEQLGWAAGSDVGLALATLSLICAIVLGVFFINWHNRRTGTLLDDEAFDRQRRLMIRSGYNLINFGRRINTNPVAVVIAVLAFGLAIGLGWGILQCLIWLEEVLIGARSSIRFFTYLPLFTFAMLGGIVVQLGLRKLGRPSLIQRRLAEVISALALDILVASAVATVSLKAIQTNLPVFALLGIAGVGWIVLCFAVLAPRMFPTYWFEKGVTNFGQSMGMTATGFLLQRLADPGNHSKARESFAYKQLVFEPFMGGGIVTAMAVVFIAEFGSVTALIVSAVSFVFWLGLGLYLYSRHRHHRHA